MKSKEKQIFNENKIEINGTVYKLVDNERRACGLCDAQPYCSIYKLHEMCEDGNKAFKKCTLSLEGLEYVAKIKSEDRTETAPCDLCDIPKSVCSQHRIINNKCIKLPGAYFEYIGLKQNNEDHEGTKQNKEECEDTSKKRKFDPKNCQRSIKDQFTVGDITFTLTCHHSFEWTIAKTETRNKKEKVTIEIYPNRNAAKKEYERKKKLSK